MMYNFASEKTVDKKGNINSLRIKSILPGSDGGTYVIWQHQWTEEGNHADVHHYDNVLVQYYNNAKKMLWEKPIFKQQANRATAENIYAGIADFIVNDKQKNLIKEYMVVRHTSMELKWFLYALSLLFSGHV